VEGVAGDYAGVEFEDDSVARNCGAGHGGSEVIGDSRELVFPQIWADFWQKLVQKSVAIPGSLAIFRVPFRLSKGKLDSFQF
jgi:hypothetical protein